MSSAKASAIDEIKLAEQLVSVVPGVLAEMRKRVLSMKFQEVTLPQFRILAQLNCQKLNNREIAENLGLNVTTMSRMVDVLVEKGLVQRNQSSKDRRQVTLRLTRQGKQKFEHVHQEIVRMYASEIARMNLQEKKTLAAGMGLLENFVGRCN